MYFLTVICKVTGFGCAVFSILLLQLFLTPTVDHCYSLPMVLPKFGMVWTLTGLVMHGAVRGCQMLDNDVIWRGWDNASLWNALLYGHVQSDCREYYDVIFCNTSAITCA